VEDDKGDEEGGERVAGTIVTIKRKTCLNILAQLNVYRKQKINE
jgi:hypothetical protein